MLLTIKGMARATYYYNVKERIDKYANLRKEIVRIFEKNNGRYGYRRVHLQLREEGHKVNHKTVAKLMNKMGLYARKPKLRYRSYKGDVGKTAPNILQRDFVADAPNRKWTTDVTQIDICGKKCYLSPILDMWNGEVISYTISDHPDLKMVVDMLQKAFRKHPNLGNLIMHSDQGWHYQHTHYQYLLREHGITQSMSRKGNCLDNAIMENFFGLMKNELLYPNRWKDIEDFKVALKQYIRYYNKERIKLKLKMSPVKYRTHFLNQVK
jgi:transposase InsO family protein